MNVNRKDIQGSWQFCFCSEPTGLPDRYEQEINVPGCFDVSGDYDGMRGVGYYRRSLNLENDWNYRLCFEGVAHNAEVFFDGRLIAEHHGGFTGFSVDIPSCKAGEHELVVAADNRFADLDRPLAMEHFDWYSCGGIIRRVHLRQWKDVIIDCVRPVVLDWRRGSVRLDMDFTCGKDCPARVPLEVLVDGREITRQETVSAGGKASVEIAIPDPKPWSPDNPHLYNLEVRLGGDSLSVNLGLRQIATEGNQILLNDEPIRIKGINRHDCHVDYGFTLPERVILNDVEQIKKLGCNFVRTSHYPPSHEFLDLCDKLGLMVWCEATSWGYDEKMLTDSRTVAAQRQCITEMVTQYAHHPGIVCWGFLNECASNAPSARGVYEQLTGLIRKLDPSRPITYASNKFPLENAGQGQQGGQQEDMMFDLVDWVSVNFYPGWYGGDLSDCAERIDGLIEDICRGGLESGPVIISELGAGGIPGFDTAKPVKWSLSYQSQLLEKVLERVRQRKEFAGIFVWQFGDIRTSDALWANRPRGYNNKGIVDEYRKPKPAFETVQKIYHDNW